MSVVEITGEQSRPSMAGDKRHGRSRVTNGSTLLPGVDGRSGWVRRCKDLILQHTSDLGGQDEISAAEQSLIRRISTTEVELEQLEARFAAGMASPADLDLYVRTSGGLRRMLESIGLKRRAKEIGPSLGELIRRDHERQRQRDWEQRERELAAKEKAIDG